MAKKKKKIKEHDLAQKSVMLITRVFNEIITCNAQDIYQAVDLLEGANTGIDKYAKFYHKTLVDSGLPIEDVKGFSFTAIAYRFLLLDKLGLDDQYFANFIQLPLMEQQGLSIREQHVRWDELSEKLDAKKDQDKQTWEVMRLELDLMTPKGPLIEIAGGKLH